MGGLRHVRPVTYLVLPDADAPFLLARVRWPDVYQAISPVRTDWQDDPGLFDLPYAPASVHISYEQAVAIAEGWGARIPSEETEQQSGPSLIRRMPSEWSGLSTAERRAWSIEIEKPARRALGLANVAALDRMASQEISPSNEPVPSTSPVKRPRWGRRKAVPVIDLTERTEAVHTIADSA